EEDRHPVEGHAARGLLLGDARDLDALSALARRGEDQHVLAEIAARRGGLREQERLEPRERGWLLRRRIEPAVLLGLDGERLAEVEQRSLVARGDGGEELWGARGEGGDELALERGDDGDIEQEERLIEDAADARRRAGGLPERAPLPRSHSREAEHEGAI